MKSLSIAFFILFIIKSSWVAAKNGNNLLPKKIRPTQDDYNERVCPPLGLGVNFEVTTIQTKTRMYGCAYLQRDTVISTTPLFNLWLERPVETNIHTHCDSLSNSGNIDHFVFECMPKYNPVNSEENVQGWHYLTLLERRPYYSSNNNETYEMPYYRCAVYDVHDASVEGVKIIRMAISAPIEGRTDESQCLGLAKTMGQDYLPYIPEGRRTWPNGSIYLYLLGRPSFDGHKKK